MLKRNQQYTLIHFWPLSGGFKKRIDLLLSVLSERGIVYRVTSVKEFIVFVFSGKPCSVLVYSSLMMPFIFLVRVFKHNCDVYYMVRGDEITYVLANGRRFRAFVAFVFQWFIKILGCTFVFVSEDLKRLFEQRLGTLRNVALLPNTIGTTLPASRSLFNRVAIVGDFGTGKNIEWVIDNLSSGQFHVDLYGNSTLPQAWERPWLTSHGFVNNLSEHLQRDAILIRSSQAKSRFCPMISVLFAKNKCAFTGYTALWLESQQIKYMTLEFARLG